MPLPALRLTLSLRRNRPHFILREQHHLFGWLGVWLAIVGLCASCVAHHSLIEEAWKEAVWRSGLPVEEIRRPEVLEPSPGFKNAPLPRDEANQPVVAQYFPLTHQVRIYARLAMPMKRVLLREFLLAIYFDRLTSRPLDVESLAEMESARRWVEQALLKDSETAR